MKRMAQFASFFCIAILSLCIATTDARIHANTNTSEALAAWSELKFGLFLHWGIFSVWGIDASWSLEWSYMHGNNPNLTEAEQTAYRKAYWDLNKVFDPQEYDPKYWAKIAKAAGFKYVVMTTKHHDGFNMYATQLSPYSVIGPESPCQRDLYGELVTAFRNEGIMIGAYYSKADWHSKLYWSSAFPSTRDVDYDPETNPDLWSKFVAYDQGQLEELMKMYNPDILWLDGEWVMPSYEDIFIEEIGNMARSYNPNVLMVNRRGGIEEDYFTPEEQASPYPLLDYWESCNVMGTYWAFKPDDDYKSTGDLLVMLISVVSNGGNLLLDIGPQPNGEIPAVAQSRMSEIGNWLRTNGESIYSSHVIFPYQFTDEVANVTGTNTWNINYYMTARDNFVYLIFTPPYDDYTFNLKLEIYFRHRLPGNTLTGVDLLGSSQKLTWNFEKDRLVIQNLPPNLPNPYASVFKLTYQNKIPVE